MTRSKKRVRTPILLQMHATECGAACLGIVLAYFNCWIPLTVLRDKCEVSRDGSSAANIMRAAKSFGLDCKGLGVGAQLLPKLKLPLILFWQYSHFIVLEGFDEQSYYINDPAIGRRKIFDEEFLKGYSGLALQFEKGENFITKGKRVSIFKKVQPLIQGTISDLVGIIACAVMIALLLIVIPLSLKVFIDTVLIGQGNWWIVVLVLLLGGILAYFLTLIQQQILHRISIRISVMGFERGILRLLRLRISYFVHRMTGDILDRVLSNDRIGKSLTEHYILMLTEFTLATVMLFAMAVFDTWLTLLVVSLAILQGILTSALNFHRSTTGEILSREQGMLLGLGIQLLGYAENLRITGSDDRFFAWWAGQQALESKARQHYTKFAHFNEALPILMTAFRNAAIVIIGGNLVIAGDMTLGTFAGFCILAEMSMVPIGKLFRFTEKRSVLATEFQKLEDISKSHVDDSCQQIGTNSNSIVTFNGRLQLAGMLEIKNITFGYNKNLPPLIKDFNLVIKPGQRVAFVGPSGSGKSTIARIVTGIVQPWEGEILFDNHTRYEIPVEVLNRSLAMVDQEIVLFPASVRDNISLWNPEVPDDVIIAATRDACIHHEILIRPEGYSTIVQEGGKNFSGGQRQRIEIARALVGNPAMLILDEATSALDSLTEMEIDRAISRRGVTCLIIAHRLSTVRDCDLIVVFDQGKEVQRGTHDELVVDKNGTYFNLVMSE
ncbi:MAG: cysteine peptidase family C39 domain-containing protein [Paracoccaceae bacterium]|nr:cysteine peptidase family C39 domain-containing protein [Paracoccaceae bacterium]MDE2917732.1 cysteine peptidase family C39 domain-containing protein [Paracoccaceae bacterium]